MPFRPSMMTILVYKTGTTACVKAHPWIRTLQTLSNTALTGQDMNSNVRGSASLYEEAGFCYDEIYSKCKSWSRRHSRQVGSIFGHLGPHAWKDIIRWDVIAEQWPLQLEDIWAERQILSACTNDTQLLCNTISNFPGILEYCRRPSYNPRATRA